MQKLVSNGKEAMDKILEGVNLVANPVKSTISPKGRTVIIGKSYVGDYNIKSLPVEVSKDGYKVALSIQSSDPEVQIGVQLIQQVASKQMEDAGDSTSGVCLLTQAILSGGLKLIEEGVSPVNVVAGINAAVGYVCDELQKMATPIDGNVEMIRNVATVCSNNDEEIGGLISRAFERIGALGVIRIDESKGRETKIEIEDGITFPCGWASPYFVPVDSPKPETTLDKPYILIYDSSITKLEDTQFGTGLMPLLQKFADNIKNTGVQRSILILCDKIDGEALATMTYNNAQGSFRCCAVELAILGDKKQEFMSDVAAATGGTFINDLIGIKLENVQIDHLGQATKVIIGKDDTVVIGGNKDEAAFLKLSESLKKQELEIEEGEEKELMRKRIARLNGSVAILHVGATTEVEMREKKDRVDDAVRATRSAVECGVVVGGGTAFLRVKPNVFSDNSEGFLGGVSVVNAAIKKPLEQICTNAGVKYEDIYKEVMWGYPKDDTKKMFNPNMGYNAKTDTIEDLAKAGIIEPVKSNICALQNAASVCCQILSSNYMIVDTL